MLSAGCLSSRLCGREISSPYINDLGILLVYFYPTENYIDGVEFVSLTLPEIKEMVPTIG